MLGEISPTTEIDWSPVAVGEKGMEIDWFPGAVGERVTEINWSPVVVGEKGKGKANGTQSFSPVGLKVLVVDDNRVCLAVLEKMLNRCKYTVTTCNSAAMALSLVQDNSTPFDLVLCDVHMPGMDGFKLLEALVPVRDLPVIMMSSDDETDVVMKGITQGACDYFLKPVCLQRLRTIWQHVFRRREMIEAAKDNDGTDTETGRVSKLSRDRDNCRKRKGKEEAMDEPVEFVNSNKKKTRLVWTTTLHKQFVDAVKNLGTANAVPKQILEKMNVKGISRENVASHLQKYRKYLIDQETSNDDGKDSGGGVNGHSHIRDPVLDGGHFGGSIEIQSGVIHTLRYNVPSLDCSNTGPFLRSPNTISSRPSPHTQCSLHSPNTATSLCSPSIVPSLHTPLPLSSFHSSHTTPSLHCQQTRSFPSVHIVRSFHSSQPLSSDYNVDSELYPIPSQSFQTVGTVSSSSGVTSGQSVSQLDLASSSNFLHRTLQVPSMVDVYSPTLLAPPFYSTEYQV